MQITLFSHRARGAHTQTHTYRWRPFAVLSFNVAEELRRNQLHSWALSLVLECLMPFLIVISFVVISYYYWFAFIFFYAIKFNWNVHSFYLLLLKQVVVVFWTIEEKMVGSLDFVLSTMPSPHRLHVYDIDSWYESRDDVFLLHDHFPWGLHDNWFYYCLYHFSLNSVKNWTQKKNKNWTITKLD